MYCKTCRQPLPHDARRCPNCGAPVENTVLQSGARDFTADYDPRDRITAMLRAQPAFANDLWASAAQQANRQFAEKFTSVTARIAS